MRYIFFTVLLVKLRKGFELSHSFNNALLIFKLLALNNVYFTMKINFQYSHGFILSLSMNEFVKFRLNAIMLSMFSCKTK